MTGNCTAERHEFLNLDKSKIELCKVDFFLTRNLFFIKKIASRSIDISSHGCYNVWHERYDT